MRAGSAGLQDSQPLELLFDEQHRLSHLDVGLLVLGPLARQRGTPSCPYAILPEEFFDFSEDWTCVHTPLGELRLELRWSVEDTLAAVALGLALRLPPEEIVERLSRMVELPLAA